MIKERKEKCGEWRSHLLVPISFLQCRCGPCAAREKKKKKRRRKEEEKGRGKSQQQAKRPRQKDEKGIHTWKFVGCPIFDLSTFFTGFLRFDLAAGFDPLLFSFSFGTSDEPKPFPYLESAGGACLATVPPMANVGCINKLRSFRWCFPESVVGGHRWRGPNMRLCQVFLWRV